MKFSIKSAGQYSNALSNLLRDLANFYGSPERQGFVKVTETHKKSNIVVGDLNIQFQDETKEIKPESKLAQVDPNIRIQIIEDLCAEKNKIDQEIAKQKSELTVVSPITGETVSIDFAKKENSFYNNNLIFAYNSINIDETDTIEKESTVKIVVDGKEVAFNYPVEITKECLLDLESITQKTLELKEKLQKESEEIDRLQASTTFEFDNKYSIFETKESLIKKYVGK